MLSRIATAVSVLVAIALIVVGIVQLSIKKNNAKTLENVSVVLKNNSDLGTALGKAVLEENLQAALDQIKIDGAQKSQKIDMDARERIVTVFVDQTIETIKHKAQVQRDEASKKSEDRIKAEKTFYPIKLFSSHVVIWGLVLLFGSLAAYFMSKFLQMHFYFVRDERRQRMTQISVSQQQSLPGGKKSLPKGKEASDKE